MLSRHSVIVDVHYYYCYCHEHHNITQHLLFKPIEQIVGVE